MHLSLSHTDPTPPQVREAANLAKEICRPLPPPWSSSLEFSANFWNIAPEYVVVDSNSQCKKAVTKVLLTFSLDPISLPLPNAKRLNGNSSRFLDKAALQLKEGSFPID
ncbi:hypothetical protein GmHk_02G003113 [Glycine max]|nr:hypothetical protein GmHk_02G003113 [Glycine max]KAH1259829.1 hypothetical protein GmHk_02G003113 [Glycine max]